MKLNGRMMGTLFMGVLLMTTACKGNQQAKEEAKSDTTEVKREVLASEDGEPVSTALDVVSFGFLGPVQESFCQQYTVKEEGADILEKGEPVESGNDENGYSFDAEGRVTGDAYGGVYNYDDKGKFTKGINAKSVMKRDEQGRVVYYSHKEDDEDDAMFTNEFTYDKKGRIVKIVESFWEWQITKIYTYEGDNIYPSTRRYKRLDEGMEAESETTYRYTKFDALGNWTERELRYRGNTTEEGETTRWNGANIEVRTIKYY